MRGAVLYELILWICVATRQRSSSVITAVVMLEVRPLVLMKIE